LATLDVVSDGRLVVGSPKPTRIAISPSACPKAGYGKVKYSPKSIFQKGAARLV